MPSRAAVAVVLLCSLAACKSDSSAAKSRGAAEAKPGRAETPPSTSALKDRCDETEQCVRLCEKENDLDACFLLADRYWLGTNGHEHDPAKSLRYGTVACEGGHASACGILGLHYQDGVGTGWDAKKAVEVYTRACDGGDGVGCYNLASMYFGGHGVRADTARGEKLSKRARESWQRACDAGDAERCMNLAFFYSKGGERDMNKVAELNQRACDAGIKAGCVQLAHARNDSGKLSDDDYVAELEKLCREREASACFSLFGERVEDEPKRALAFAVTGCELGDKWACDIAGVALMRGDILPRDSETAVTFFERACARAHADACVNAAAVHHEEGRRDRAAGFLERGCTAGSREACGTLGAAYLAGEGVTADEAKALEWFRTGCQMGDAPSCMFLIDKGEELPVPPDMKRSLMATACQQGMQQACE